MSSRYVYSSSLLLFPLKNFAKKILCLNVLLRRFFHEWSAFFFFHSLPWRKAFLRTTAPFYCFLCFWKKKNFLKKIFRIFWKKKIILFSSLFVFCSSRFAFTSVVHFRFCLIFGFFLISFFLNSFFFYFTFFSFLRTTISPSCCIKKKVFKYPFYMHGMPLDVLLLTHFSKSKKKTCLFISFFCWALFMCICFQMFVLFFFSMFPSFVPFSCVFSNIFLFCSRSWMFFSVGPFLLISFWVFLCLVWSSFFLHFLLSLLHKKSNVFWIVSFCNCFFFTKTVFLPCWSFEREMFLCVLFFLLVFLFSENLQCNVS